MVLYFGPGIGGPTPCENMYKIYKSVIYELMIYNSDLAMYRSIFLIITELWSISIFHIYIYMGFDRIYQSGMIVIYDLATYIHVERTKISDDENNISFGTVFESFMCLS